MAYHFITNRRPGIPLPLDGQDIHSSWCSCSDCAFIRPGSLRLDLLVLALGGGAALLAVAVLVGAPAVYRLFAGWVL